MSKYLSYFLVRSNYVNARAVILSHRSQTLWHVCLWFFSLRNIYYSVFQIHYFFPLPYPGSHKASPINCSFLTQYSSFSSIWVFLILYNSDKILYLFMNAFPLDFFFHIYHGNFKVYLIIAILSLNLLLQTTCKRTFLTLGHISFLFFFSYLIIFDCMPDSLHKRTVEGCLGDSVG